MAGRTKKEYASDNKNKIAIYQKNHYAKNKEKIDAYNNKYNADNKEKNHKVQKINREKNKTIVICECGGKYNIKRGGAKREHERSDKHERYARINPQIKI
jgi:hypothetical protein